MPFIPQQFIFSFLLKKIECDELMTLKEITECCVIALEYICQLGQDNGILHFFQYMYNYLLTKNLAHKNKVMYGLLVFPIPLILI